MSKYITVTRDGRVAAPVYRGLVEAYGARTDLHLDPRDSGLGTLLRAMHQHPRSIPLYLIRITNTPSMLNQHSFVPIESQDPSESPRTLRVSDVCVFV